MSKTSKKKHKISTTEIYFKDKKNNKLCGVDRDDMDSYFNQIKNKFDKTGAYGYFITVFFENYGWRKCKGYYTHDSKKILLWNVEYKNEDFEEDTGDIYSIKVDKIPIEFLDLDF